MLQLHQKSSDLDCFEDQMCHTRYCIPLATSRQNDIFCRQVKVLGSCFNIENTDPLATYSVTKNDVWYCCIH